MTPTFKTLLTGLCLFTSVSATVLFCVLHWHHTSRTVDKKVDKQVSHGALSPTREEAFRRKAVNDASEVPGKLSAPSTNAIVRHANEDLMECFSEGTIPGMKNSSCICKKGWNGIDCSIPDAVWLTQVFKIWYSKGIIRRRSRPRRIISGLVFNHELDLLEIRVKELGDAVDHYLVVESTYTYSGLEKPLHLRSNLSAGFLREHAHKIVPISVDFYNYDGGNPWGPENYVRTSIWYEGHRRLKNIRDDDLFFISDADEIPSRDVVLFLKHHDGYGEPILLSLRWFVYGFFWENSVPVNVSGVCTVSFLRQVYENDSLRLRSMKTFTKNNMSNTGTFSEMWTIQGTSPHYSGWHCSWCFDAEGIQVKLAAAQRDDGVRWGDIAEKTDLGYINSLRKRGYFFDESGPLERCDAYDAAPAYVRENAERYRWLMRP
ncbi:beta-1,4-mannosyl-glycoprotein 4-beta-N-acetylglucosaminyltransferase-like isoform X2 [Dermacentor andersoni]|uniref:beta-1,4-mannosyl-glycoprotein 4-beta-N-acetylglucosaminyltransferase-like isoform X2 n=1 Tax=Dermacentor andersoni TaxID=34620 RepID=UPI002415E889|nr:beta-1,4-mannosyl-glycoprotein 4-beta-N-acetylglucosaminyltransferase-like isoform X2 [Dermacentor andersoni]